MRPDSGLGSRRFKSCRPDHQIHCRLLVDLGGFELAPVVDRTQVILRSQRMHRSHKNGALGCKRRAVQVSLAAAFCNPRPKLRFLPRAHELPNCVRSQNDGGRADSQHSSDQRIRSIRKVLTDAGRLHVPKSDQVPRTFLARIGAQAYFGIRKRCATSQDVLTRRSGYVEICRAARF